MYIVRQDREMIINADLVETFFVDDDDDEIKAYLMGNDTWIGIADYDTEERAKEVFQELMKFLETGYIRGFFYMPEE